MHPEYQQWKDIEHLKKLDNPDRESLMPKAPVLTAMELEPGMGVADVGSGLGYFTLPLAQLVGNAGAIYAVDPSSAARKELLVRATQQNLSWIETIDGAAENTTLKDASCHRVLWHTIFHELVDRPQAIREMRRILRPHGLLVVVDWLSEDTGMGPPLKHRVTAEFAAEELRGGGFAIHKIFSPGPVTWGVVAKNE